ncbi:MAG TPA: sugar transferase [Candidatus Paceibacterota bacterium]|nr:sugar transferase [Candidatus Paceibacterota bacterium]
MGNKTKLFLLFLGDVVMLYAALFATLALRYGGGFWEEFEDVHAVPFSILFIFWLLIFYVAGLYDLRRLRNNLDFLKTLALSLVATAVISILAFYLIPELGIAPKTNLFIFIVIFAVIEIFWRRLFNRLTESGEAPNRTLLVGSGTTAEEAAMTVEGNPQLGYTIAAHMTEDEASGAPAHLEKVVAAHRVNLIVVPRALKRKAALAPELYKLFGTGITIIDLDNFYEIIMRKVPLGDVEEAWFLENIENAAKFYDPFKRALEFLVALVGGVILLPIELLIALIVAVTSRGPVLIRQKRVGALGREFTLYKFRSMVALAPDGQAETKGAEWARPGDLRVTPFGRFIRASHLDELPQFWNVIRGDISFVGPRAERPEFVRDLKAKIPFYEVRLLVKPGVTGWAQLNHRADLSLDDVKQKLQYDVYYLKNRSPILDVAIVLKTLKSFFVNPK